MRVRDNMAVRRYFLCVLLAFVGLYLATAASSSCPLPFEDEYKPGTCFKAFRTSRPYAEAVDFCKEVGGMLAEPRDANMSAFIEQLIFDNREIIYEGYMIGVNDMSEEGQFVYESDGKAIKYANWDQSFNQPSGYSAYDCIVLYRIDATWFDTPCSGYGWYFICQYGPPIDGGWTRFSPYSECSTTCGYGVQNRSRSCTNPAPQYGGRNCEGPAETTAACKDNPPCTDPCTVNPCKNGGTCTNIDENIRQCECLQYYTLPDCEPCSCWNFDDCDQARCVVILILYLMIVLISGVGAAIVVKLWMTKKKQAGKAWRDAKKQGHK